MGFDVVRPVPVDTVALDSSNVAEATAAWLVGTTYAEDNVVYDTVDGIHVQFTSLSAGNVGNVPIDSPDKWRDDGPTNRWAMFDETISTLTTNAETIEVTFTIPEFERIDCLYLAGLDAETVRIEVEDPIDGAVYDETFSLADVSGITDWYAYFFDPVLFHDDLLVTDLPNGTGSTITVTITKTDDTAACGALVTGFRKSLGFTQWNAVTEIRDYSKFLEDEVTGDRELVRGNYRKLLSCRVIIENRTKDATEKLLAEGRAEVRLYIADEDYSSLTILGTCRWSNEMSMPPSRSLGTLQLESVV